MDCSFSEERSAGAVPLAMAAMISGARKLRSINRDTYGPEMPSRSPTSDADSAPPEKSSSLQANPLAIRLGFFFSFELQECYDPQGATGAADSRAIDWWVVMIAGGADNPLQNSLAENWFNALGRWVRKLSRSIANPPLLIDFYSMSMCFIPFFYENPPVTAVFIIIIVRGVSKAISPGAKTITRVAIAIYRKTGANEGKDAKIDKDAAMVVATVRIGCRGHRNHACTKNCSSNK